MHYWLKSQKKIHGHFSHLIIPEYHKDGKSIHFHGLFRGYNGNIKTAVNNGKVVRSKNASKLYNISSWRNGFSTAALINDDDYEKVANYVTKYITKDMPKFSGKNRYWTSRDLIRPVVTHNVKLSSSYELISENERLKVYRSDVDL